MQPAELIHHKPCKIFSLRCLLYLDCAASAVTNCNSILQTVALISFLPQGGCRGGTMICRKEVPLPPPPLTHLTTTHTLFARGWKKNVVLDDIQFHLVLFRGVQLQNNLGSKTRKTSTEHCLWLSRRKNYLFNYDKVFIDKQ